MDIFNNRMKNLIKKKRKDNTMCNYLHENHEKIPEDGEGFKIFNPEDTPVFGSGYYGRSYYESDNDWIVWDSVDSRFISPVNHLEYISGFCIFLTREAAEKCLRDLKSGAGYWVFDESYILPIKYKQGLGKHIEHAMVNGEHEIAIVKQFRIIKD
jgi:hypothetical protein